MREADEKGRTAEALAARYLTYKGYQILETRYRCRWGEIDLIAQKEDLIIFAEVKYRSQLSYGRPALAVDAAKQQRIRRTALFYLRQSRKMDLSYRFDVIELWQENGKYKVHHYRNAFEGEKNGF